MSDNYKIADFLARAYEADQAAAKTKNATVAENWRRIAEDFRIIARLISAHQDDAANNSSVGAKPSAPLQRKQ